jgi:hypothetical protein
VDLMTGISLTPLQVGAHAAAAGWDAGWRIQDTAAGAIWHGGCPACLFQVTPVVFVLEAQTMQIVAVDYDGELDLLGLVEEIDAS